MIVWLNAQLSPRLARWIEETAEVECLHVRDLGLRNAEAPEIFQKARDAQSVVTTKDEDFSKASLRLFVFKIVDETAIVELFDELTVDEIFRLCLFRFGIFCSQGIDHRLQSR